MTQEQRRPRPPQIWRSIFGIPHWVQAWLLMLIGVNLASVFFLGSPIGRWTLLTLAVIGSINIPLAIKQRGLTRLLSFPHLLWIGLLVYLIPQILGPGSAPLPAGSPLQIFTLSVVAVNATSLAFDLLECARWLRGGKEVLGLEPPR